MSLSLATSKQGPKDYGLPVGVSTLCWCRHLFGIILNNSMSAPTKITYVSLSADDPEVSAGFDKAIAKVRGALGKTAPLHIGGQTRLAASTVESRSPADTRVLVGRVASGTAEDVNDAVAAARAAYPAWSATPWG